MRRIVSAFSAITVALIVLAGCSSAASTDTVETIVDQPAAAPAPAPELPSLPVEALTQWSTVDTFGNGTASIQVKRLWVGGICEQESWSNTSSAQFEIMVIPGITNKHECTVGLPG